MKNWYLLSLAFALTLLQTGCAGMHDSNYLTPSTIKTSFDNVQVRVSEGKLLVTVQDMEDNLTIEPVHVVEATSSSYTNITKLTLVGKVVAPETPHQVQLVFVPAPQPPFSLNVTVKIDGHARSLRADYYGPKSITY